MMFQSLKKSFSVVLLDQKVCVRAWNTPGGLYIDTLHDTDVFVTSHTLSQAHHVICRGRSSQLERIKSCVCVSVCVCGGTLATLSGRGRGQSLTFQSGVLRQCVRRRFPSAVSSHSDFELWETRKSFKSWTSNFDFVQLLFGFITIYSVLW